MSHPPFEMLLSHLRWADRAVLESLRAAAPHASALELFSHIVGAEETWLARLESREPRAAVWPDITLEEAAELGESVHASLGRWIDTADDERLAAEITYRNSAGQQFTTRASDILTHVMMHGSYHRGQIALLLRQSGATPAPTDYVAFIRGVPAASRTVPE